MNKQNKRERVNKSHVVGREMGKHTEKQFVYLSQQLGRNTHPERKDMGVLSKEEG